MKLWVKILIIVLVLAVVGGGIFGIVKLADQGKFDYKKISNLAYGIGGLDGSGKYMNTDQSIYTKDAFECQGLNCTLVFDNDISYQIYFYDQNNEFVHTTGKLTGAFVQDSVPFFAKYARIVITPNDDNKVSLLEVNKYAKQLKTTVYREQGFKNYTENLVGNLVAENAFISFTTGELSTEGDHTTSVSDYINISSYKEGLIFKSVGALDVNCIYCYDAHKSFIGNFNIGKNAKSVFVSSENVHYYGIDFSSIKYGENATEKYDTAISYVRLCYVPNLPFEFYCR